MDKIPTPSNAFSFSLDLYEEWEANLPSTESSNIFKRDLGRLIHNALVKYPGARVKRASIYFTDQSEVILSLVDNKLFLEIKERSPEKNTLRRFFNILKKLFS